MSKICKCSDGMGNSGTVTCLGDVKNVKKIFAVPTFDSTGAKNKFLKSATLDAAFLTARLNDVDESKRWRPINDLENVTDVRADSTYETAASGRKSFVKDGVRSFSAELWGASNANSQYLGVLQGMKCTDMSVFMLDTNDNFIGAEPNPEDLYFYPVRLDKNSWEPKLIKATDTTQQKINLLFDFHPNEEDAQLRLIDSNEYTCDFAGAIGLLDIFATYQSTGQTAMVVDLYTRFGTAKTKKVMTGLLAVDFALFNVTTSLAVVVISATENPDGTYTLIYASQNVSDVLRLTPTKDGYDFSAVVDATSVVI